MKKKTQNKHFWDIQNRLYVYIYIYIYHLLNNRGGGVRKIIIIISYLSTMWFLLFCVFSDWW
jgi:hypothetical protein